MSTATDISADVSVEAGASRLSGRIAGPRTGHRGLIIAFHGGTYDCAYYDGGPDSLLTLGALLGYLVVALDRPGYGATASAEPSDLSFDAQTRILSAAVKSLVKEYADGGRAVLAGHSIGGMLALRVAAEESASLIAGVEVSGLGQRWQPGLLEMWSSLISDAPSVTIPAEPHGQVMLGPAGSYAAGTQERNAALIRPMSMPELIDVCAWADALPAVAAQVSVPVSVTLAEHDHIWQADPDARAAVAAHFTASPSARIELFPSAGHSIELHRNARAYCLRQLASAEEWLSA
jgi:pimeloyl-ACP methyl ester carboxylesterase